MYKGALDKGLGRFKHLKGLYAGGFFFSLSLSLPLALSPIAFLFDRANQKQQSHHKNRQLLRPGYEYIETVTNCCVKFQSRVKSPLVVGVAIIAYNR